MANPGGGKPADSRARLRSRLLGAAIPLGVVIHFSLSVVYGYVFGLTSTESRARTRQNVAREAALGFGYGALLWAFNFQLVARMLYPWLAETNPIAQLALHGVGFGVPLGLLFCQKEQARVRRMGQP